MKRAAKIDGEGNRRVDDSAMQVGFAPRKNPGKMMWEMVLLGRRMGPMGR